MEQKLRATLPHSKQMTLAVSETVRNVRSMIKDAHDGHVRGTGKGKPVWPLLQPFQAKVETRNFRICGRSTKTRAATCIDPFGDRGQSRDEIEDRLGPAEAFVVCNELIKVTSSGWT